MSGSTETLPGPCCYCGGTDKPRQAIVALPYRAPTPGTGWGCVVCGLPTDGAVAIACTDCEADGMDDGLLVCIDGAVGESLPVVEFDRSEPFQHDEEKHRAAEASDG